MTFAAVSNWLFSTEFLIAAGVFFTVYLALKATASIVLRQATRFSKQTDIIWDDILIDFVESLSKFLFIVVSLSVATRFIVLSDVWQGRVDTTMIVLTLVAIILSLQQFLVRVIRIILRRRAPEDSQEAARSMADFLGIIVRVLLWAIGLVMILQNLGFKVTALLGSLGVLGIAVGFALQNVLSDFFAFFSIYFDKPFEVGDFIMVGDTGGTVKHIGIKSTRISTLRGEELVISNKQLTETAVHNFKKLETRRVLFTFGVEYGTPLKKVQLIPELVTEIAQQVADIDFKRVHLVNLGDSALEFEVEYYVTTQEYLRSVEVQHQINMQLMEVFAKHKISFAFPTQTIHLEK